MELIGLLSSIFIKSMVLLVPLTVTWLAFRRLVKSRTTNAWLYAAAGLLTALTSAGLAPWAVGLSQANWLFFVLAAFSPAIWLGVVTVCGYYSQNSYGDAVQEVAHPPLILEQPDWPDAPTAVFRHHASEPIATETMVADDTPRGVLAVARDMRGNKSSDKRRHPLMLPAPSTSIESLPFVR